jgi:hypothetical protein
MNFIKGKIFELWEAINEKRIITFCLD